MGARLMAIDLKGQDSALHALLKALNDHIEQLHKEQVLTNIYLSKLIGEDLRNDMEQETKL